VSITTAFSSLLLLVLPQRNTAVRLWRKGAAGLQSFGSGLMEMAIGPALAAPVRVPTTRFPSSTETVTSHPVAAAAEVTTAGSTVTVALALSAATEVTMWSESMYAAEGTNSSHTVAQIPDVEVYLLVAFVA
jgi:hypothetical protein